MTTPTPVRLDLPQQARSVGRARSFVIRQCVEAGMPEDMCDTAALLTSEAVTNTFVHGHSDAHLAVTVDASGLLVEVGDDDRRQPVRRTPDPEDLGGRGLAIVAHLASSWGSYGTSTGKIVWFRLDR